VGWTINQKRKTTTGIKPMTPAASLPNTNKPSFIPFSHKNINVYGIYCNMIEQESGQALIEMIQNTRYIPATVRLPGMYSLMLAAGGCAVTRSDHGGHHWPDTYGPHSSLACL
jgi:hypothetical protein